MVAFVYWAEAITPHRATKTHAAKTRNEPKRIIFVDSSKSVHFFDDRKLRQIETHQKQLVSE
jgi:hypothetical protein